MGDFGVGTCCALVALFFFFKKYFYLWHAFLFVYRILEVFCFVLFN